MPFSALIRFFTFSRWHHCGVIVNESVIESRVFKGVTITPLDEFKSRGSYRVFEVPLPDEEAALEWLLNQLGKPYDYFGLVRFAAHQRWLQDDKHYCTDLPAIAAIRGGRPLFNIDVSGYAPRDFNLLPAIELEV